VSAGYTGTPPIGPDGEQAGLWGIRPGKEIELPTGGVYFEQVTPPLAEVTEIAEVEDRDWGDPTAFDFAGAAEAARARARDARHHGRVPGALCGSVGPLRVEKALLNLALRPKLVERVLEKVMTFRLEQHRLLFEACAGYLDLANVTDDYGAQNGLIMSHRTIREIFWPWYREAIGLAHKHGLKVFHHDDGGCDPLLPDLIEMGVEILNPVQYKCWKIDLETAKREYGKDLCFHGSVENQAIIPFGTPEEVAGGGAQEHQDSRQRWHRSDHRGRATISSQGRRLRMCWRCMTRSRWQGGWGRKPHPLPLPRVESGARRAA